MAKEIFGIKAPSRECADKNCPFHGEMGVKKELISGVVIKKDLGNSATIEWSKSIYVPKYERYQKKRFRMRVHNPDCIAAQIGQEVVVARSRPISKTKNHIILNVVEKEQQAKK
jgi:small subunit ribosomal protein S17